MATASLALVDCGEWMTAVAACGVAYDRWAQGAGVEGEEFSGAYVDGATKFRMVGLAPQEEVRVESGVVRWSGVAVSFEDDDLGVGGHRPSTVRGTRVQQCHR
jgi:hypothetical protein